MSGPADIQSVGASRRRLMFEVALLVGAAGVLGVGMAPPRASAAQAKLPPKDIGYQNTPKGGQRCDLCVNWLAPASCKLVAGPISPAGWCSLFARKP